MLYISSYGAFPRITNKLSGVILKIIDFRILLESSIYPKREEVIGLASQTGPIYGFSFLLVVCPQCSRFMKF